MQTDILIPHEDCQGIDGVCSACIPSANCGTCFAYQQWISLQFILAQVASIFLYSKNKGMPDQNIKKYILLCVLTCDIPATLQNRQKSIPSSISADALKLFESLGN